MSMDDLIARQSVAETRLAEVRRQLAEHPYDRALEDEEHTIEGDIAALKIMRSMHKFAVTMARLEMAANAGNN
jgi:hypothetical protein